MRLKREEGPRFVPRAVESEPSTIFLLRREEFSDSTLRNLLAALGADDSTKIDHHVEQFKKRDAGMYDWSRCSSFEGWGWSDLSKVFDLPVHESQVTNALLTWTLDLFNPNNSECRFPFHDPSLVGLTLSINESSLGIPYEPQRKRENAKQTQRIVGELLRRALSVVSPDFVFGGGVSHFALSFHFSKKPMPRNVTFKDFMWYRAVYDEQDWQALGMSERWGSQDDEIVVPPLDVEIRGPERGTLRLFRERMGGGRLYVYSNASDNDDDAACARRLGLPSATGSSLKEVPMVLIRD